MKLGFDITLDDYYVLALLHAKRREKGNVGQSGKKSDERSGFSILLTFLASVILLCLHMQAGIVLLGAFAAAIFGFLVWPWIAASSCRAQAKKTRQAVGPMEMEVVPEGVVVRRGDYESLIRWGSVGDLVTEGERTFLYLGENTIVPIPHRRITSGNYVLFLQELAKHLETHTLAPFQVGPAPPAVVIPTPSLVAAEPVAEKVTLRQS